MTANSKFDLSSGSPDRHAYSSGQRGVYTATSLERLGSFREGVENRILSVLPSMSRCSSSVNQGDIPGFFQCLGFDPKMMAPDHKLHRQGELKRVLVSCLGISPDDSSSGSSKNKLLPAPLVEELKRVKAGLRDTIIRARERAKTWNEAILLFDKYFPSIPSRKRSRVDVSSSDRSNALLSSDRPVPGTGLSKMGTQIHAMSGGFELEPQKSEERTKISVPSKRTRTSMVDAKMDVRSNSLVRPLAPTDRDREMFRLSNTGSVQSEEKDRALSAGVDGWEKSKMKKKRSGIKPDLNTTAMSTRTLDGDRESKQGMQQRLVADARSRLSDTHGFRSGPVNGSGKVDIVSQQTGIGMRSAMTRNDQENVSLLSDRKDRPTGSEREKMNLKAMNKPNAREEFSSASPTSTMRINASTRAPRSGSVSAPKSSPNVHRAGAADEWEISQNTNRLHTVVGATNRKRTSLTRSSSPPVAQWAVQRPQKMSRGARRTNFHPLVSNHDEVPALDTVSTGAGNENVLGFPKRLPSNMHQQVKVKNDPLSSAALSESEESGAAEIKSRDRGKIAGVMDDKSGQSVQKVATLVLPSRKNKLASDEELGDVRRQGRTGRGYTSSRCAMSMTVGKLDNVGTAKQLRSVKAGYDRIESKAGRPPTRKLSDRRAYTRQKHTTNNAVPDFHVESDDSHAALLAAANAVINPFHACSSLFWRKMELLFGFVSPRDIAYLKQEICSLDEFFANIHGTCDTDRNVKGLLGSSSVPNGTGLIKHEKDMGLTCQTKSEILQEQLAPRNDVVPLCQRLLAALVTEEDHPELFCKQNEETKLDACETTFELVAELTSNSLNHWSTGNFQTMRRPASNGFQVTAATGHPFESEHDEYDEVVDPNAWMFSDFRHSLNGLHPEQEFLPIMSCTEFEYNQMSLDERLLLEVQSIGIFPEPVPDLSQREDEEISEDISRLEEKHHAQLSMKKSLLCKLEKSVTEARELQEKEMECRALDILVGMTYEKYMNCCSRNASGGKSVNSKMARHAALAFVKQTLEQCQKFEDTGKSCFNEPKFRELFLSMSSHFSDTECIDNIMEGESANVNVDTPTCSLEVKISASVESHQTRPISSSGHNMDTSDKYASDDFQPVNHPSERTTVKEDIWLNKSKKRELLLDDVGGTVRTSLRGPPGVGSSLLSSTKGKRSERDREGKGHNREMPSRSGAKIGRPALGNAKGDRKSKTKPKQKTAQLSASVNGLIGKISEQPKAVKPLVSASCKFTAGSIVDGKDDLGLDSLNDSEAIDLSNLPLPGMDVLGGQGQDLSSWLNIDDDGLQDQDFMGLEIPMDDLADLNMML